ncbi:hypothetical protein A7985_03080 [Pseudoalteromonas luteoviolacea]|uniref:Dienelactone hydrolase domain-containing protein n=1 Tax=Pseudoalteromonas luteoviolacea TaxID=43657 RepID=A0A1C0TUG9_9GAMM|nr:hypothetical protein [Pseudoalteromonas luteoviolacea]OCQ22958.1 hypothetical protein A7985_03080 [Pseudoalteromonas luteoviolacea]
MITLVVSDIFGQTKSLEGFVNELDGSTAICSPYPFRQGHIDRDEPSVYQQFIETTGHEKYVEKVVEAISSKQPDLIIGFSAGAVASWRALAAMPIKSATKLIAFYPGQIRNHLQLHPKCDVDIYFPYEEKHFDVKPVIEHLSGVHGVSCYRTRYLHGFMNSLSENFCAQAYQHYTRLCQGNIEDAIKLKLANRRIKSGLELTM